MNAANTKFGYIFIDLVNNLLECFPTCPHTLRLHRQLQEDPEQLNTIKLDWARFIEPMKITSFKRTMEYFTTVERKVSATHTFNQLQLAQKYKSLGEAGDRDGQDMLCQTLLELEDYSLDDSEVDNQMMDGDSDTKTMQGPSRFDDAELHNMCMEAFKDNPQLVLDLQQIARNEPLLNRLFAKNTNQQICKRMVQMKPLLPKLLQWMKDGTIPIQKIVGIMAKALPKEDKMQPTQSMYRKPAPITNATATMSVD